jgi:hypothetical protein
MPQGRLPRVPFGRTVSVTPEGDSAEPLELDGVNLSLGGMSLKGGDELPAGTRVALQLTAAGRRLDFAHGEVVWRAQAGVGLRFTELRPRAQALVEHLVARGGTGAPPFVARSRKRRGTAVISTLVVLVACGGMAVLRPRPQPVVDVVRELPLPPPAPMSIVAVPQVMEPVSPGEYQVALPTGAVSALSFRVSDSEVVVDPQLRRGSSIKKVFTLSAPARLVIDVGGRIPKYSWQLEGSSVVKSVRVGARHHGTRVVVDLPDGGSKTYRVITPPGVI